MSKKNDDFFREKKIWSKVKDELLDCYLRPYFQKVISRGNILYVDGFAGKGRFDDGQNGSPLIALEQSAVTKCGGGHSIIMRFIELNHAPDLKTNLSNRTEEYAVIEGDFEDCVKPLLKGHSDSNLFLYIDPYGIKALDMCFLKSLPPMCSTVELLINLNSFGFIREACGVMKVVFQEEAILEEIEEYDSTAVDSMDKLNAIAGGSYWQDIIRKYPDRKQAEKEFSKGYKQCLQEKYTYVLDMPIRLRAGHQPKYRMVHATNHPDGCVLMADNMIKRKDFLFIDIQNKGQVALFPQTTENEVIDDETLKTKVTESLNSVPKHIRLNKFLADFYTRHGVLCSSSNIAGILNEFEINQKIEVVRKPSLTEKTGKPSSFWTETNNKTIQLRKRS